MGLNAKHGNLFKRFNLISKQFSASIMQLCCYTIDQKTQFFISQFSCSYTFTVLSWKGQGVQDFIACYCNTVPAAAAALGPILQNLFCRNTIAVKLWQLLMHDLGCSTVSLHLDIFVPALQDIFNFDGTNLKVQTQFVPQIMRHNLAFVCSMSATGQSKI